MSPPRLPPHRSSLALLLATRRHLRACVSLVRSELLPQTPSSSSSTLPQQSSFIAPQLFPRKPSSRAAQAGGSPAVALVGRDEDALLRIVIPRPAGQIVRLARSPNRQHCFAAEGGGQDDAGGGVGFFFMEAQELRRLDEWSVCHPMARPGRPIAVLRSRGLAGKTSLAQ